MGDTIADIVRAIGSTRHSDPVVLAPGRDSSTGRDLVNHVDGLADAIRGAGVGHGEIVASVMPNGPEAITSFLAATSVGTAAPLNPRFRASELSFYLDDLEPSLVIVPEDVSDETVDACNLSAVPVMRVRPKGSAGSVEIVSAPARGTAQNSRTPSPDDVALVLHTSGTTSRPKMVPLTHTNLTVSAGNVAATLGLGHEDRCLNVMPLFHIHGLVAALLASLKSGGSIVASPGFISTEFFGWMASFQPSWYTAVPTIHQSILERSRRPDGFEPSANLRFIRSSSASLPPAVMEELESTFQVPVVEAYGMTEAAHQITCNPLPPAIRTPGSVGRPAGPEVAILGEAGPHTRPAEEGEVLVKGRNVTKGYLGMDSSVAFVDGWFRTGDIGSFDRDGYLRLTGRLKEMINRAGETIAPREIDEALLAHDAVAQALAFGVPDRRLGEQPAAAVVLADGHDADEMSLRRWVEERLSTAKVPRRVVFLDAIPTGPTGKLQRIGMAERLGLSDLDEHPATEAEKVPPRTRTEEVVLDVWEEVLDRQDLGVEDRFLDVGGDSMLAMRLLSRIRELLGIDPSVVEFFDRATVGAQAELIDERLLEDD